MDRQEERFRYLFGQFIAKKASQEELNELFELFKQPEYEQSGKELLDTYYAGPVKEKELDKAYWLNKLQTITGTAPAELTSERADNRVHFLWLSRWAAVAAAVVAIFGAYLYFHNQKGMTEPIAKIHAPADVRPPQKNRASITLADGEKLFLDQVSAGMLALQGTTKIIKNGEGKLTYQSGEREAAVTANALNTLYNPRGSQVISLSLSDGSKVWLNAESSLTYPASFAGNERKVLISGEAYFEVAHDAVKPFIVSRGDDEIKVLGTHFNVNAYEDEPELRVTLLEGSVKITQLSTHQAQVIRQGEQIALAQAGGSTMHFEKNVDLDKVMAWKNGQFLLKGTDLTQLLRQVSRWYDIDIDNKRNDSNIKFGGSIARSVNLSTIIEALKIKGVNCRLEGNKLVVE